MVDRTMYQTPVLVVSQDRADDERVDWSINADLYDVTVVRRCEEALAILERVSGPVVLVLDAPVPEDFARVVLEAVAPGAPARGRLDPAVLLVSDDVDASLNDAVCELLQPLEYHDLGAMSRGVPHEATLRVIASLVKELLTPGDRQAIEAERVAVQRRYGMEVTYVAHCRPWYADNPAAALAPGMVGTLIGDFVTPDDPAPGLRFVTRVVRMGTQCWREHIDANGDWVPCETADDRCSQAHYRTIQVPLEVARSGASEAGALLTAPRPRLAN